MRFKPFSLHRGGPALAAFTLLVVAVTLAHGRSPVQAAQPDGRSTRVIRGPVEPMISYPTDQIIVWFADGAESSLLSTASRGRLMDDLSTAAGVELTYFRPMSGGAYVLKLPARYPEAQVARMSRDLTALPEVTYAEPDAVVQIVGQPSFQARPQSPSLVPDDPDYSAQWHYRYDPGVEEGINLPPAWDITTGSASTVVGVIDTGIRPHADLAGRTVQGYDFIVDLSHANDGDGRDADPSDPGDWVTTNQCGTHSAQPSSWHGTHVAGTIGAATNNTDDVAGINWNARILPLRVLGTCGGFTSDIADAMRWGAGLPVAGVPPNLNPAGVLNLSLGGFGPCTVTYQDAIDAVVANNVVVVVAAGNSAANASGFRPANCNGVITVAATNRVGTYSYYSNYGSVVEISAPGGETIVNDADGVLSTLNDGQTVPGNDIVEFYQGTSMAAPHIAGLVSLLLGEQPGLTPAQVNDLIQTTARPFPQGSGCNTNDCGAGIADAFAALTALTNQLDPPALTAPGDGSTVDTLTPTLEWSAVDGADGYHLQVSATSDFSNIVTDDDTLVNLLAEPTLPADGQYWWRVAARAGGQDGPWSDVWSFTVSTEVCNTPAAPALLSPDDQSVSADPTPTFSWDSVADATDYEIRIGMQPDAEDALVVGLPVTNEYTPGDPLTPGATYYWKVRGRNMAGNCDVVGDWSDVRQLSIEQTAVLDYFLYLPSVLTN